MTFNLCQKFIQKNLKSYLNSLKFRKNKLKKNINNKNQRKHKKNKEKKRNKGEYKNVYFKINLTLIVNKM